MDSKQPLMSEAEQKANAAKLRAETKLVLAEAAEAEAKAKVAELKAQEAADDDRAKRAGDKYHHLYRFNGAVNESSARDCMKKLTEWHRLDPECDIEIVFFSPGGEIMSGMQLFDFIVDLRETHEVTTGGTGMAASMAGILVQAGTKRYMSREGWLLIHRAQFHALGKTFEIEDEVEFIKRIEKRIIQIFTTRSKLKAATIRRKWDRKDWWLSSDECLELGLVDEIRASA